MTPLLKGNQSACRDQFKGSYCYFFSTLFLMPCSFYPECTAKLNKVQDSEEYLSLIQPVNALASPHAVVMADVPLEALVHILGIQVCWALALEMVLLRNVFCSFQRGSLAGSKDGEILPPAAQHPSARGGGHYWSEPISPLAAPQQGHSHEDPKKGSPLHLVRPQAARGGPA